MVFVGHAVKVGSECREVSSVCRMPSQLKWKHACAEKERARHIRQSMDPGHAGRHMLSIMFFRLLVCCPTCSLEQLEMQGLLCF